MITNLPISDRPAEALAISTRENHKEMSMNVKIILVINIVYFLNNLHFKGY